MARQISVSSPVFFRVHKCQPATSKHIVQSEPIQKHVGERVYRLLNQKVYLLLKYESKLSRIDSRITRITRPLEEASNGITFISLGDSGFKVNDSDRMICFNLDIAMKLTQTVSSEWLHLALMLFILHEISHISQGIKHHEDVKKLKEVNKDIGRERMGELDLRSDFLSIRSLSLLLMLHEEKVYKENKYIEWLYKISRNVSRKMLDVFPAGDRKDKQQRIFGWLLMSNLIRDAYTLPNVPLEFNAELWPVWSDALDKISLYSNGEPWLPGCSIDPNLMNKILRDISEGRYDEASSGIDKLWRHLSRR